MASPDTPNSARLEQLREALREEGLPMTVQRRAIFECLYGRTDHPSADTVFDAVQESLAGVSRPTVYRVLDTFVQLGLVRRIEHPGSAVRYDPRTDRHHHLVCTQCGRVDDYELPRKSRVSIPDAEESGFEISDYSIHFTGRCSDCAE